MTAPRPTNPVPALLTAWQQARQELRAIEQTEHPDLTDRHGRTWQWKDKTLYTHDGLLAATADVIAHPDLGLPIVGLADDNPNYAGLCAICRREVGRPGRAARVRSLLAELAAQGQAGNAYFDSLTRELAGLEAPEDDTC